MKIKSLVLASSLIALAWQAPVALSAGAGGDDFEMIGTPAPGSPFAKLHAGMYSKEVTDLVGQPTDSKIYQTGKAFIPFHFGSDNWRMEAHYKGQGVLTYSGGGMSDMTSQKLIRVKVDPQESGYVH